jgi:zinc protease
VPLFDPAAVVRHTLANGLRVLVRRDASAPVVAVNTYVNAGYFDEPDAVAGVAHVLEHMFFKGTRRRGVGEIAKQTKAQGGYLNAHTIYDHTSYYAVLPAAGWVEGLDIQADAYAGSVIDAAELAKELEVIIQEARRKLDNPSAVTVETLYALLHDRHRMRRWRIGTEDGLRRLTQGDVAGFYRAYYRPEQHRLVRGGRRGPGPGARRDRGALRRGARRRPPPRPRPGGAGPRAGLPLPGAGRRRAADAGGHRLAHAGHGRPRHAAPRPGRGRAGHGPVVAPVPGGARALARVERGGVRRHAHRARGVHGARGGRRGHRADAARAAWGEVAALRAAGVGADELTRVQRVTAARAVRRLETMEGQASWLAEWESHGDWAMGEAYHDALLSASAAEVTEAARRWLAPDAAGAVVYRPRDGAPLAPDAAAFRRLLDGRDAGAAYTPVAAAPPVRPIEAPAVHAGPPRAERVEGGVHVFRTAAGVPVLVVPRPGARIVHLGATVLGGAAAEPDDALGITALMAAASVKGTASRGAAEIAELAERMGGSVGASAGAETFGWGISVPTAELAGAAALLADVVQRASFPDDCVETERRVAAQELRTLRDDMYRWPIRLAAEAAYAGHPYGRPVGGTEETLAALTPERVRAWHRAVTREAASVLAVAGDVDPAEAAALLGAAFDELAPAEPPAVPDVRWGGDVRVRAEQRAKRQTALALLVPGPSRRDPERLVAGLLAGVASGLGGRFFDELRDRRSLAYTVAAFASPRGTGGRSAPTSPPRPSRRTRRATGSSASSRGWSKAA